MSEVADLWATLGARVDAASWAKADAQLQRAAKAAAKLDEAAKARPDAAAAAARKAIADRGAAEERIAARREAIAKRTAAAEERAQRTAAATAQREQDKAARAHESAAARAEKASARVAGTVQVMGAVAGAAALYMGQRWVREGVQFNSTIEDTKNEIAAMLSLARKSDFNAELGTAGDLMDRLRKQAAALPGETSEYVAMLGRITQPIIDAKLSLKDLEDLTVASVVASKGMHIQWEVAARDIDQAIRGQFHSVDQFTGKVLGSIGYKGEEGRTKYNALSQEKRAEELKRALSQPQFADMAKAAGSSFSGTMSTLADAWHTLLGAVTKPLFDALGVSIKQINKWLDDNKAKVAEVAEQIGTVLLGAFRVVGAVIGFFVEHSDLAIAALTAIGALLAGLAIMWIAGFWPIFVVIAAVTALVYGLRKLMDYPGGIGKAFRDAFEAVKRAVGSVASAIKDAFSAAFDFVADMPVIHELIWLVNKLMAIAGVSNYKSGKQLQDASSMSPEDFAKAHPELGTPEAQDANARWRALVDGRSAMLAPPAAPPGGMNIASVDVGGITVTSQSSDPAAVALEVGRVFDARLGAVLRRTMDEVA